MRLDISDLLTAASIEELPGARQADTARLTEAVSRKIKEEKMQKTKKRARTGRILLIAAAIAAALSIAGLAYGLSLRDAVSDEIVWPVTGEKTELLGAYPGGGTEAAAVREWVEYRQDADTLPAVSYEEFEELRAKIPSGSWALGAWTEEAAERLAEIAQKHGLTLPGEAADVSTQSELYAALGSGPFLPAADARAASTGGTVFDTGSFDWGGAFTLENGDAADYGLYCTVRGTMPGMDRFFADLDGMEQWSFTTPGGVNVLLGAGAEMSVLYAETGSCYILVNIRAGLESAYHEASQDGIHGALTRSDLEGFASGIDFDAIESAAGK